VDERKKEAGHVPRWRTTVLDTIREHLAQLGLQSCPVCNNGAMGVVRHPLLLEPGAIDAESEEGDEDRNRLFMVQIVCTSCGYSMLFNGEKFLGGSEEAFVVGTTSEGEVGSGARQGV
jgi:hypothetical protein